MIATKFCRHSLLKYWGLLNNLGGGSLGYGEVLFSTVQFGTSMSEPLTIGGAGGGGESTETSRLICCRSSVDSTVQTHMSVKMERKLVLKGRLFA